MFGWCTDGLREGSVSGLREGGVISLRGYIERVGHLGVCVGVRDGRDGMLEGWTDGCPVGF